MTARRLRAPAIDGGLLVEPPAAAVAGALAANSRLLADWDHDFQGRRAHWLRSTVRRGGRSRRRGDFSTVTVCRRQTYRLRPSSGSECPLIVTGHQPELFHPGVWIKNFAAAAIARASGGVGLNLIVDNDIPKSTSIAVPVSRRREHRPRSRRVRPLGRRCAL